MRQPSMDSLEDSGWINETEDPLASPSPKKVAVLKPSKRASKDLYKSDSSISWIWEVVGESDESENSYEEESITESPLTQEKLKQKSMEWDMSIINSAGSDDELYFDPSTRSLNKPSSRMNLTEKMNKSNSSLLSIDVLSVAEQKQGDPTENSKENLITSGLSLATAYVDDDETAVGVRFNPTPEVRLYITRDEYGEEEYFQCFYSSMETELMLQSRNKLIDKINAGKMKNPDTMRGLEYWVEVTSSQIDRRVDAMIQRVMDEQDDQIERGVDDQLKLAELSLSVSVESMAVALKIATRDARLAKKAYRQMFEKQELDLQTFKSSSTETTAAMSSVVLPESLAEKSSSKHKRGDDVDASTRSNRSVSSRRSSRSKSKRDRKSKKQATAEDDNDDVETSQHSKKMKKRNSDTSKKSSKRKDLKKQSSERSVGSRKSTSSKKKSKKKAKVTEAILEEEEHVINGEGEELEVAPASSSSKMKKRRSSESTKKKRRSSASDNKVKGKKSSKRASETELKVKKKPNNKDKRRSSAPAGLLIKQKKRSSSSRNLVKEDSDRSIDPKALTSSLSSEEDEHLRRTKEQSKMTAPASTNRRSFMDSEIYKQMGTSWMQFLEDTGEDITRAALLDD